MVTLTCYGGVNQVGGNQFLLQDGDSNIFLDFGTPYARWNTYYEEYMKPRPGRGLLDVLEMGLLPPIRGLYRPDLDLGDEMWTRYRSKPGFLDISDRGCQAVLITHAHLDHCGYVSFVKDGIPVIATATTALLLKAMQDSSAGAQFERETSYYTPRRYQPDLEYLMVLRQGNESVRVQRPFALVDRDSLPEGVVDFLRKLVKLQGKAPSWQEFTTPADIATSANNAGRLPLRAFPVDHSVLGACSLAVQTSVGWIAHTGDIRFQGKHGVNTHRAVASLRALQPRVLLCEGTRTDTDMGASEEEVSNNALKAVREANGKLVIADFAANNLERLATFLQVARETKRNLVVLSRDAYLIEYVSLVEPDVPSLRDNPDILVYKEPQGTLPNWEKLIRTTYASRLVSTKEVRQNRGQFLLCFSFWDLNNLIDIEPYGAEYIFSSSEAHNEEQEIDHQRLKHWLDHFHIRARGTIAGEDGFHASGHASGEELLKAISEIKPKLLIPIHTNNPSFFVEELQDSDIRVILPKEGEMMNLEQLLRQ